MPVSGNCHHANVGAVNRSAKLRGKLALQYELATWSFQTKVSDLPTVFQLRESRSLVGLVGGHAISKPQNMPHSMEVSTHCCFDSFCRHQSVQQVLNQDLNKTHFENAGITNMLDCLVAFSIFSCFGDSDSSFATNHCWPIHSVHSSNWCQNLADMLKNCLSCWYCSLYY